MLEQYYFLILPLYILICLSFPELNVILFLFIGRLHFEPRLGLFDCFSLNQINFAILLFHFFWAVKFHKGFNQVKFSGVSVYILLIIWLCYSFLFHSNNIEYAFDKIISIVFISLTSAMFLVIRFQYYGTIIIRNFILFFALIGTGMAFIGLFSLTQGLPDQRLAVLGGGPNVFARIIGSTILIVSVFYRNIKEKLPRIVIILLFFGLFVAQISTLSKGPLLSLILVFGLLLIVFNQKRSFVKNLSVTIIVFALVISIMILFNLSERYFLNPFDDVSYGSYGTRFQHFRDSVEIFHASPLIGIGLGDFVEVSSRFTYPHNIFLEILSELGLIGILLFCSGLFFFARSIRTFLKYGITGSNNMINYNKILISLSLFMFLNQLVSGDLMDARFMFVFIILSTILGKELNNRIVNE